MENDLPLIYLAEDDPFMARMFERIFKLSGYRIVIANDGDQAVQKLEALPSAPIVILLDVMMPKRSGFEVLEHIKANSRYRDIPAIMLSNLAGKEDTDRALALGAIGYIIKSQQEPKEVVAKILSLLPSEVVASPVPSIPMPVAPPLPPETSNPDVQAARKKKILLADDDQYIRRAYTFGLKKDGFEVLNASNGKEAIEQARISQPDLILLDQMMPIMNGFDALKILKSDEALRHIPVLFFTNLETPADTQRAKELGASDYLVKAEMTMKDVLTKVLEHISA